MTDTNPIGTRESKVYVSQKAILVDEQGNILAMRRSKTAPSRPLHWDLPGGDIEVGGELKKDIAREIREETQLEVDELQILDAIGANNDKQEYWITICYTAKPQSKNVVLSYEHDEFQWITPEEFLKLKISPRTHQFIERFSAVKHK